MVNKTYDRKSKQYVEDDSRSKILIFLYNTIIGRILLKLIFTRKTLSRIYAIYMKSRISKHKINKFIKKYKIDLEEYIEKDYRNFNEFFIRQIKEERRPISKEKHKLISIADGKLKAYKITEDLQLHIKNSIYSIDELIEDKEIAKEYSGGECLIFRLSVENYHRYCYIDNGRQDKNKKIKGVLHTVQPISQNRYKVYSQNSREWTILHTENFDDVLQIEVGAILVGKIRNHYENNTFKKGDEKGYFEFGGSTIVLLIKKDAVKIDDDIVENSKNDVETFVKIGESIGERVC